MPCGISYGNGFVSDIPWKKVWTLPHKYLITNKIREINFKLIHRFYPDKCLLKRLKNDINTLCSFCLEKDFENSGQIFFLTNLFFFLTNLSFFLSK